MKKLLIFLLCCIFLCSGCELTVTTSQEEADEYGSILDWAGFERCENGNCDD